MTPRIYTRGGYSVVPPPGTFARTGEFRPPRAGEWYLSGAIPEAWQAARDLDTAYHILRPVKLHKCPTCEGTGKAAHGGRR